jgi:hypothetical protein
LPPLNFNYIIHFLEFFHVNFSLKIQQLELNYVHHKLQKNNQNNRQIDNKELELYTKIKKNKIK